MSPHDVMTCANQRCSTQVVKPDHQSRQKTLATHPHLVCGGGGGGREGASEGRFPAPTFCIKLDTNAPTPAHPEHPLETRVFRVGGGGVPW